MKAITSILVLGFSIFMLTACSDNNIAIPEDTFEPNNDIANATPSNANTTYAGRQWDEDWFQIEVTTGFERVVAVLAFSHANGDINIELQDAGGTVLATSESTSDNEQINFTVSADGIYYLRVFGNNSGNSYDLSWNGLQPPPADDQNEENDTLVSATALLEVTPLIGVQLDDDWYQITVQPGFEHVIATLVFTHADGDIDLELYDAGGIVIAVSQTTNDNEQIDFLVSSDGTYYLRVFDFGSGSGNTYSLSWDGMRTDDQYEENDDLASATALPEDTALDAVQLDDDWYHITVLPGFERVIADLTFSHADGDLDLELYDSSQTRIGAPANSSTDNERIAVDVVTSGEYYLKVYNFAGNNTGNAYTLIWDAPADDLYEPNNDLASAYGLAENTSVSGIQLDDDWYRIDVTPGSLHLVIDLTFLHASGDLDIVLYNSAGTFRASSESSSDNEQIDFTVAAGGTYYLQIYDGTNVNGSTGNTYDLIWSRP